MNGTEAVAQTAHARVRALTAISLAESHMREAEEMLEIVKDFEGISTRVQEGAAHALTKVRLVRNTSEAVITNVTAVQLATDAPHDLAMRALSFSNQAKNISDREPGVSRHKTFIPREFARKFLDLPSQATGGDEGLRSR